MNVSELTTRVSPVRSRYPAWRWTTIVLTALSLSVGWGIRGDFGHEYGAMFAGCLAALTVCLASGRPDWRERVLYFGFFGAIGWGFGGSVSYMQVISFTESGHLASQWYGYIALFYIGFLWAALGGAGTAMPAAMSRDDLTRLFTPVLFVFAAWFLQDRIEDPVAAAMQEHISFDHTWGRHKSPLYWFDADYLAAFFALLGAGIYDLWERRERNTGYLPVMMSAGAVVGYGCQLLLHQAGLTDALTSSLSYLLGDPAYIDPETGGLKFTADNFLNNWPQWFGDYPQHVGWFVGMVLGITAYFACFGRFRNGASLIVCMASGWLLSFLLFPVLGSIFFTEIGGLRMTPPRGDDWAGITGVFGGLMFWMYRHQHTAVIKAALLSGTIGGLGFSGVQWIKQLMMAPGNPRILTARGLVPGSKAYQESIAVWAHWQGQNWHSFLEQTYGFVNGLGIAIALGVLAVKLPVRQTDEETGNISRKWTLAVAAFFVLFTVLYLNVVKNVKEWGEQLKSGAWTETITLADGATETVPAHWDMPYIGRLPGVSGVSFTPETWYNVSWIILAAVFVLVVRRHRQEPVALIPPTWLGRGQLVFLILIWVMVIGDFERALVGWHPSRLLTEWVIFVNAALATVLVLLAPRQNDNNLVISTGSRIEALYRINWKIIVGIAAVAGTLFLVTNRIIYRYPPYEQLDTKHYHTRFGPEASWRAKPNLKNAPHK